MKKELVLVQSEYIQETEKFETVFKLSIEEYLKIYNLNCQQVSKHDIGYI